MKKNWIILAGMLFCTVLCMQARSSGNVCIIYVPHKKFYNNNNRATHQNNYNRTNTRIHQPRRHNHKTHVSARKNQ